MERIIFGNLETTIVSELKERMSEPFILIESVQGESELIEMAGKRNGEALTIVLESRMGDSVSIVERLKPWEQDVSVFILCDRGNIGELDQLVRNSSCLGRETRCVEYESAGELVRVLKESREGGAENSGRKVSRSKLLESIFEFAPMGVVVLDSKRRVVELNSKAESMLGASASALVGSSLVERFELDKQVTLSELFERNGDPTDDCSFVSRFENESGRKTFIDVNARSLVDDDGEVFVILMLRDLVREGGSERERLHLLRAIEQVGESVVVMDSNAKIQYINPVYEKTIGYSRDEILGKHPRFFMSDEQNCSVYDDLWNTLAGGDVWSGRIVNKRKDGSLLIEEAVVSAVYDESGKLVNYVSVQRDVTHESELEKQLQQTQKLESVGTLAGGIAHDFNNILQTILGFNEMAMSIYEGESKRCLLYTSDAADE